MKIICTGSIAYDYLMNFPGYFKDHILPDHLESISLSFLVDNMVRQRGGTAPNIAYSLALLGDHPFLMGTVGCDFEEYRNWLESKGVNTQYVRVIPEKYTASFFANTDLANNQIASFYSGAMVDAVDLSLKDLSCDVSSLVVISPNDPRAMQKYVRECHEMGLKYLYDPSQQVVRSPGEELKEGVQGAYCLFVNEYEFELLQKHTGMSADQIRQSVNFMVVTCAEKGALVYADKTYQIPVVVPERILDPTGVGDAFRSGFLRGMQMGSNWQTCGQMGALAAAYCLEQRGTQVHHYTPAEFITRYRFHFDDQGALDTLLAKS